ncbi:TPA: conjugal transfer protein [Legionella pneumophila]|nr:conjugal transfer protein [Legionella pneumophila]
MRLRLIGLISILPVLFTGCGTMNSNFSCNVTAGDSCLTIEQVDAMTRFADDVKPAQSRRAEKHADNLIPNHQGKIIQKNGQSLWVSQRLKEQSWV